MQNVLTNSTPLLAERTNQYRRVAREILEARREGRAKEFMPSRISPPAPMLFGGYIRDSFLGAAPADMDVHILTAKWYVPAGWRKLDAKEMVQITGDDSFKVRMADGYDGATRTKAASLGYYAVPDVEVPVNIVQGDDFMSVKDMLEWPDFGMNQCVYCADGTHLIVMSDQAKHDLDNRTMTWNAVRGLDGLARSKTRADRITARLAAQGVDLRADFSGALRLQRQVEAELEIDEDMLMIAIGD